jgi:hypothetical protein
MEVDIELGILGFNILAVLFFIGLYLMLRRDR